MANVLMVPCDSCAKIRTGHTVKIQKENGSIAVQYFTEEDGAIMLDPDVKAHFPDSESVNKALRSLITQH